MGRPSPLRTLTWALLGGLLIWGLHTTFWYGGGRNEFNMHWGIPDRMLGFGESRLYLLMFALGLPAGFCFAQALAGGRLLERFDWALFWSTRRGLLVPACLAALGAFLIAHFVTHYAWFTDDEQAYLLQAELYARGQLTMPVIEPKGILKHGFTVEVLPRDGVPQWSGVYPPFQPFLMGLSSFLGSPNLSQFLCVGLIVYNAARLAQRLFERADCGAVTAWLCATSPLLLGLGATYHTSILGTLLTLFSARLVLWSSERGGLLQGLPLGLVAGSIVLCRPLEGALVVGLSILALLWALGRPRTNAGPTRLSNVLALVGFGLGGLVPLAIMVWVNMKLTGHPLQGAYANLEKEIGRFIGFGNDMMWGRTHSPELGVVQTVTSLVRVNAFAFGWPLSLSLVGLGLYGPLRDRRVLVLLAISVLHLSAYFFLAFGSVHDFGHAYHVWHLPTIAVISSWVLVRSRELAAESPTAHALARGLRLSVAAMFVVAGAVFWPAEITRWRDVSEVIWAPVRAAEAATHGERAVVLWSAVQPPGTQRTWVFRPPAPHPSSHLLWAYDSASWYPYLKKHLPDRKFYRLTWNGQEPVVNPVEL
jgi:hypothetical protein